MFASDIHGSAKYCRMVLSAFKKERASVLALLGDVLYHGPRNPLPEEYAPAEVAKMLAPLKHKIICVRGNCDSEVDQMVLPFPILSESATLLCGKTRVFLAHGHKEPPPLCAGDVYVTGHTHVPLISREEGYLHLNPGSVSLPKDEAQTRAYIIFDGKVFFLQALDGEVLGVISK